MGSTAGFTLGRLEGRTGPMARPTQCGVSTGLLREDALWE